VRASFRRILYGMKTTVVVLLAGTAFAASDWNAEMARANALQQERKLDEAGVAYRAALAKALRFGERDWRYAQAANNYAAHLFERGDYLHAAEQYRTAIAGFEANGNKVNLGVARCNLAVLHRTVGQYGLAVEGATEALRVLSEAFPDGSMYHVSCEPHLAEALSAAGRPEEAEAAARHAVAMAELIAGSNDVRAAHALHVLGSVLQTSGRPEDALPALERALAIRRERFGSEHRLVGTTLATYSLVLFRAGDVPRADLAGVEAVRILEGTGGDPGYLAAALNSLAAIRAVTEPAQAEPLYRRALAISERRFGSNHPDYAKLQANLAAYYLRAGRLKSAEKLYRAAAATLRSTVGESHPSFQAVQESLADVYARMGRLTESRSVIRGLRSFRPVAGTQAGPAADHTADGRR
jgi:tetratricopeptide (TPR) repeat protein